MSAPLDPERHVADVFAALGDHTRLSLLLKLSDASPQPIGRLAAGTGLTRQGVAKHVRVLEGAGLVYRTPKGRETLVHCRREPLDQASACLDAIARQWDHALQRLRRLVEDDPDQS